MMEWDDKITAMLIIGGLGFFAMVIMYFGHDVTSIFSHAVAALGGLAIGKARNGGK